MTVEEATKEKNTGVIIPYHTTANYVDINNAVPTFDPRFLPTPSATTNQPNLKDSMAVCCVDAIVQDQGLMVARRRIKKNREGGRSVSEKLAAIKRMSVAAVFLC